MTHYNHERKANKKQIVVNEDINKAKWRQYEVNMK